MPLAMQERAQAFIPKWCITFIESGGTVIRRACGKSAITYADCDRLCRAAERCEATRGTEAYAWVKQARDRLASAVRLASSVRPAPTVRSMTIDGTRRRLFVSDDDDARLVTSLAGITSSSHATSLAQVSAQLALAARAFASRVPVDLIWRRARPADRVSDVAQNEPGDKEQRAEYA